MIGVVVFDGSNAVDRAEAATRADAIFAGQTLYDERVAFVGSFFAEQRKIEVGFYVDGKLVRLTTGRPGRWS